MSASFGCRAAAALGGPLALLACAVAYLAWAAEKGPGFLPGERWAIEAIAPFVLAGKNGWDGSLESANRQDLLIVRTLIFLGTASLAWLAGLRAVLASTVRPGFVLGIVLAGAVLLRGIPLDCPPPLETDFHRYHWDGAVTASGLNPFQFAPIEVSNFILGKNRELYAPRELERLRTLAGLAAEPALADHFRRINHPAIPTIYPPAAQLLFAVSHRLSPGGTTTLKALVALIDLAVLWLLVRLLGLLGRDRRWAVGYAWCPLIVKEVAATGHFDSMAVAGVLAALLCLAGPAGGGAGARAGAWLGVAVLSKLYPLVLLPILGRALGATGWASFAVVLLAGYAPFAAVGTKLFDGLVAFGGGWEFNSSLFALTEYGLGAWVNSGDPLVVSVVAGRKSGEDYLFFAEQTLDAFLGARVVSALLLVLLLVALAPKRGPIDLVQLTARSGGAIAGLLLLSPVADPWYFVWVAPFACVFPSPAFAWLACTMGLHYVYFVAWRYPYWTRPLEYVPFYAMLAWEAMRRRRG